MSRLTRRGFLNKSLLAAGTAGAINTVAQGGPSTLLRRASSSILGANERIRIGVIGTGGQGRHDLMTFFKHDKSLDVPVICDVDDAMMDETQKLLAKWDKPKAETIKDYRKLLERKDVDAVIIGTPDHWHPLNVIHACQAGKDMYCEKPLANSIGEGKAMVDWINKSGRVLQMGTQWRMSAHMADAVKYVQSGKLGKIRLVRCWCALAWFKPTGHVEDSETPAGVDYDMWLGPAPLRKFNRARFHFSFRWFWDYAGGLMTDWGVHLLNVALWAMNPGFPKRVASVGGKWLYSDDAETPDTQNAMYDFGDWGLVWEHQACTGHGAEGREHGVAFYGENGTLIIDSHKWEVCPEGNKLEHEIHKQEEDPELCRVKLVGDFLECCRTRSKPMMNVDVGHRVTTVAHLGNLAVRTGRSIEYDAANMKIVGNDEANAMIMRPYRSPWELPKA